MESREPSNGLGIDAAKQTAEQSLVPYAGDQESTDLIIRTIKEQWNDMTSGQIIQTQLALQTLGDERGYEITPLLVEAAGIAAVTFDQRDLTGATVAFKTLIDAGEIHQKTDDDDIAVVDEYLASLDHFESQDATDRLSGTETEFIAIALNIPTSVQGSELLRAIAEVVRGLSLEEYAELKSNVGSVSSHAQELFRLELEALKDSEDPMTVPGAEEQLEEDIQRDETFGSHTIEL